MNRQELKARLDEAGVPEREYTIEGVDRSVRGMVEGGIVLVHQDDRWVVSVEERGRSDIDRVFTTEGDACEYVYRKLTERRPIGPPLTPDEIARAESLAEKQIAEHRRWVDEHRRETGGAE